ncbi:MAG: hypothetical protein AABY01_04740 [Nanoarchaeota archaeon]
MEKNDFKIALDFLKASSEKRKFVQGVDLIINLKNLDLKQNDQQVDLFVQVPHARGKKVKVACLCGPELLPNAKQNCDLVISTDEFPKYAQDKKLVKKIARDYDFFVAQANIMPEVAKVFGRVLGPRNKMPNPKAGAVVPPTANLKPLIEKLGKTVRLTAKTQLCVKAFIGKESQPETELLDNINMLYDSFRKALPQDLNNIKNVLLKLSMSKPIHVGMAPDEIKKVWEDAAARAVISKKNRVTQQALKAETASNRKRENPEEKATKKKSKKTEGEEPVDATPIRKEDIKREVWETDLDKPRVKRVKRPGSEFK